MSRLEKNLSLTALIADCKLANSCVRSPVCLFVHICRDLRKVVHFSFCCTYMQEEIHYLCDICGAWLKRTNDSEQGNMKLRTLHRTERWKTAFDFRTNTVF